MKQMPYTPPPKTTDEKTLELLERFVSAVEKYAQAAADGKLKT